MRIFHKVFGTRRSLEKSAEPRALRIPSLEEVASRTTEKLPPAQVRTFRVFVSSTFTDFTAERDTLRERVWPRLRAFCVKHDARFQEVDLRWGVSEEAAADQQTMSICLEEIKRCQKTTPRPNFLVLVGNRIGWMPVPPQIPVDEWELIQARLDDQDWALLDKWYSRDDNLVPPQYRLRPSESADQDAWTHAEPLLHRAITAAVAGLELPEERRRSYLASATEQEIAAGAFEAERPDQVICFMREIEGYPDPRACGPDAPVRSWVDPDQSHVEGLKQRLCERLEARSDEHRRLVLEETVRWTRDRPAIDQAYLDQFAEAVAGALEAAISEELDNPLPHPAEPGDEDAFLDTEGRAHRAFAHERLAFFTGRDRELADAARYLHGTDTCPLVLHGEGGMGKSVLMAAVARDASRHLPGCVVVERYVGATPASSDVRTVLYGICCELARRAGEPETQVPGDYADLVTDFADRLGRASADRPILVLVDSLDRLSVHSLSWVPPQLPAHARLVVSTRPGDTLSAFQERARDQRTGLLEIRGLPREDAERLVDSWLADAGHALQPRQRAHVLDAFERSAHNPLYLKLAFEATRRWTSAAGLPPERLAIGLTDLIRVNLFGRLERKDQHGEVIVSRALGYLAASRYGLAEDELVDLLSRDVHVYAWFLGQTFHVPSDLRGLVPAERIETLRTDPARLNELLSHPDGPRLPAVLWSRLLSDLQPYLAVRRSEGTDVLTFYHPELHDVAKQVYAADQAGRALHTRLADYFEHNLGDVALLAAGYALVRLAAGSAADVPLHSRVLAELPWQLAEARAWERLHALLANEMQLQILWLRSHYEVREFWSRLADNSAYRLDETYAAVVEDPVAHMLVMDAIYELMTSRGGYETALIAMNEKITRQSRDDHARILAQVRQAEASINAANYDEALKLARAAEHEARKHDFEMLEADALYLQAQVMFRRDQCEKALTAITRAESIARQLGNTALINLYLKWKATTLKRMGRLQEAIELYPYLERWYLDNNDTDGLVASLFEVATLAFVSGDFEVAFARLNRAIELVEEMGSRRWLLHLYITSALMYSQAKLPAQAIVNFEKYQSLRHELGQDDVLKPFEAAEYAVSLVAANRNEDALKICEQYEPLARGPKGRNANTLRILLWAHLRAISDLQPIWRTTIPYREYMSYREQQERLSEEYQAVKEEDERMLSDPANALVVKLGRQVRDRAEEWRRPTAPPRK